MFAPLVAIAVYTFAFTTNLQLSQRRAPAQRVTYALFIFSGIVIFNFFSEMAFRSPMLLHEYAHYIKQTIFPERHAGGDRDAAGDGLHRNFRRRAAALPA